MVELVVGYVAKRIGNVEKVYVVEQVDMSVVAVVETNVVGVVVVVCSTLESHTMFLVSWIFLADLTERSLRCGPP